MSTISKLFDPKEIKKGTTETGASQSQLTGWGPGMAGVQTGVQSAIDAFRTGVGSQPYTQSLVTPFSQYSTQAFGNLNSLANQFQPGLTQAGMNIAALNSQGGLNAMQDLSMRQLAPFAAQQPGQGTAQLNDIQRRGLTGYEALANMKPAEGYAQLNDIQKNAYGLLNPIAHGSQMTGNPYLNEVIRRSSNDITGAANLGASQAGRYGSGGHQAATQKAIGDMSSGLRFTDYNTQQGRMDAAIRDVFGFGNQANAQTEQDRALKLSGMAGRDAYGQAANTQYETDMARKLAAITGQFNAGQQQWGNITGLPGQIASGFEAAQQPGMVKRGVGAAYEDLDARARQDAYRVFQQKQNSPWQNISNLMGVVSGPASTYGIQQGQSSGTGTTTSQGASPIASGIGGALAAGSMFANPETGSPNWMAALLGGIGGLGNLKDLIS